MTDLLKHMFRCCLFIFVQVFLLNEIPPLHRYVTPHLYYLFILWLPFRIPRIALLFIAFFYGLILDAFLHTPGLHAAASTLIAYLRPFIISLLLPKEVGESGYPEPSYKSLGLIPYGTYILLLTFFHHFYLTLLEWLQFGGFFLFIGKILASTGVSLLLVIITELAFSRKSNYRTNMA